MPVPRFLHSRLMLWEMTISYLFLLPRPPTPPFPHPQMRRHMLQLSFCFSEEVDFPFCYLHTILTFHVLEVTLHPAYTDASRRWIREWKKSLVMVTKGVRVVVSADWLGPGWGEIGHCLWPWRQPWSCSSDFVKLGLVGSLYFLGLELKHNWGLDVVFSLTENSH